MHSILTCMTPSAAMAPEKTVARACRIAIIAAMKNVLSPNSETIITLQQQRTQYTCMYIYALVVSIKWISFGALPRDSELP